MRTPLVPALAALTTAAGLAVGGIGVVPAHAAAEQPFSVTFPEARLYLGDGQVDQQDPTTSTSLDGTVDDVTGEVAVPANQVNVARFTLPSGVPLIWQPNETYTGTYDAATGDLDLGGNSNLVVPTSQTGGCVFPGVDLDFSTDGASEPGNLVGSPFTDGLGPDAETGSMVASFSSLPQVQTYGSGDSSQCDTLASELAGPGALQVGFDVTPPAPDPVLTASVRPDQRTVRQGGSSVFRVRVGADGATEPVDAQVCVTLPAVERGPRIVGPSCVDAGDVSGGTAKVPFTVRATPRTRVRAYTLRFTVTAPSATSVKDTAVLRVRPQRRG